MALPYVTAGQAEKISREVAQEEIGKVPTPSGGTKLYKHEIYISYMNDNQQTSRTAKYISTSNVPLSLDNLSMGDNLFMPNVTFSSYVLNNITKPYPTAPSISLSLLHISADSPYPLIATSLSITISTIQTFTDTVTEL